MVAIEDELSKIIYEVGQPLIEKGFILKRKRFFERLNDKKQTQQYEVRLSKEKGFYHLHLILRIIDKHLLKRYNEVLKNALTDERIKFPENWNEKIINDNIKARTSRKIIHELTDWRELKLEGVSLKDFNNKFSIWVSAFHKIEDVEEWKQQLRLSTKLADEYFQKTTNIEYIVNSLNSFDDTLMLFLLGNNKEKLEKKYNEALLIRQNNKSNILELELFYEHLIDYLNPR